MTTNFNFTSSRLDGTGPGGRAETKEIALMWQNIIVYSILTLVAAFTLFSFYRKFTGKGSCCGGGCTCKTSCGDCGPRRQCL